MVDGSDQVRGGCHTSEEPRTPAAPPTPDHRRSEGIRSECPTPVLPRTPSRRANQFAIFWSDEQLLDALRAFQAERGRAPVARDFRRNPARPSSATIVDRFGSWSGALALAGLTPRHPGERRGARDWYVTPAGRALLDSLTPDQRHLPAAVPA